MNDTASTTEEMNKNLFMGLISMLSMSAMQQLGKIINPVTRKTDINLEAAQATIDTLDMLEIKTRGNRDREEDKLLTDILSSLKMNYVETAQSAPTPQPEPPREAPSPSQKPTGETPSAEASKDAESKKAKYHKSYD